MTVSQISPTRMWLQALCLCLESFVRQSTGLLPQSPIAESMAHTDLCVRIRLFGSDSSALRTSIRTRTCGMKIGSLPSSPSFTNNPPSATLRLHGPRTQLQQPASQYA